MKIGIYSGAFKPITQGHWDVIHMASKENDVVYLFVSTGDRLRADEFPIYWNSMHTIWEKYIKGALPGNVKVAFSPAPIKPMMDMLFEANNTSNKDSFIIYTDEDDFATIFYKKRLEKLAPLLSQKRLMFKKLKRGESTTEISGTLMRKYLGFEMQDKFIQGLPRPFQKHGQEIYRLLSGN